MKNYGEMYKEKYQRIGSNKYPKEGGTGVIDRKPGTVENRPLPGLLFQGQCPYTPVALAEGLLIAIFIVFAFLIPCSRFENIQIK